MQADGYDQVRPGLIAILPRLMRFADILAGARDEGRGLLGRALRRMLSEQHRYQHGSALDVWAFRELYRHWLQDLRRRIDPVANLRPANFAELFEEKEDGYFDTQTVAFLGTLPPAQRLTLLLVYGEGFEHEDAARILDVPAETIAARLVRMSAAFADRLSGREPGGGSVEPLYPEDMRTSP